MASAPSAAGCVGNEDLQTIESTKATKRSAQLRGGYECIFVEEPPKHLQTECSVCLCVLREPHLLDCCGYRFCRTCLDPIRSQNKPCPLCSLPFTTLVLDKQLQRTLENLQVCCSHKESGCDWVGELGSLLQHLNVGGEDEVSARLSGCSFAQLHCMHCGKPIQRQNITKHETDRCLERPYSCDYCHDYTSTCGDVTNNHWPICPCRSVPCPNECGKYPLRKEIKNHQADNCPLTIISCPFSYAGCKTKIPRQDMPSHITESLADHMSMQAISHQQQLNELKADVKKLKAENQKLKNQLEEQSRQVAKILRSPSGYSKEASVLATSDSSVTPILIVFKDFEQHTTWWSPPFYTHPCGYKMCLKVFPYGYRSGENTHVSVYVNLMKGEFDDQLKWPFQGEVTIRLLNSSETGDDSYCEHMVHFHERMHPRVSGRVVKGDKSIQGFGVDKFITQGALSSDGYVQDNSLRFYVLCRC